MAGNNKATSSPIIAITTKSSTSVNACRFKLNIVAPRKTNVETRANKPGEGWARNVNSHLPCWLHHAQRQTADLERERRIQQRLRPREAAGREVHGCRATPANIGAADRPARREPVGANRWVQQAPRAG